MSEPVFKPRLPVSGVQDGDQVVTSSGNIFEYNAEQNEWVCIGIIPQPDIVNTNNDGLVPPNIFRKLALIQELIDKGFDFSNFKLDSDVQNPYYYYFYSSDDLIRFTPEKCSEPKEVRLNAVVTGVDEVGAVTVVSLDMTAVTNYAGLVLETSFCNYDIISNQDNQVIIDAIDVNILSGDKVKVVKPESVVVKLRIEIDKSRLYQKLIRNCCIGPKGLKGDKGDIGFAGSPADDEIFQVPIIRENGVFAWDTTVETPIDTPISLRIFRENDDLAIIIEVLHHLDGSAQMVIINDENIVIEQTNFDSSYDLETKRFKGSFSIIHGTDDISTWRYKARQRGPKGRTGADGKMFLEVVNQLLDDPSIRSTEAIISARRGAVDGDIIILKNTLFEEVPVSNLSATVGDSIVNILEDQFTAVSVTIDEAKDIGFYQFVPKDFVVPPLDIPLWTPTADCVQHRRWAQYRFDWFNQTDPDYLFSILLNPKPDEQCCQEDFFYCPNVGDGPCGIQGEINPPVPPPTDCICECENPIASELSAGGLVLTPIDLTEEISVAQHDAEGDLIGVSQDLNQVDLVGDGGSDKLIVTENIQAIQLNTIESVIDGLEHKFKQNIKLIGNGEVIVTIDYDGDPCGGDVVERQSCAFVDSNAVRSFITLVDKTGTSVISSGGVLETKTIPIIAAFTVTGAFRSVVPTLPPTEPGLECVVEEDGKEFDLADLELNISINTTGVEYCRGYRLTVTAISDESFNSLDGDGKFKKAAVINKIPIGGGIPIEEEVETFVPLPPGGGVDPPTFIPEPSFASDGLIIKGGELTKQIETALILLQQSNYGVEFTTNLFNTSGTGQNQLFVGFETNIGQLVATPGNSIAPLIHDGSQDNILLTIPEILLSKFDAAYDVSGPLGVGTYVRAQDFGTLISNRIPNVGIRQDSWTDVVAFISAPQEPGDVFRLIILGRLRESVLLDSASSTFFNSMFESGVGDAILIFNGVYNEDPMVAINNGSIVFGETGKFSIGYLGELEADRIYPKVLVGINGPPPEEIPGSGLNKLEIITSSVIAGDSNIIEITFETEDAIPIDGQFWVQFPNGFDLSGAGFIGGSDTINGGISIVVEDNLIKIIRLGDGNLTPAGPLSIIIGGIVNPITPGSYIIEFSTRTFGGVVINGPEDTDLINIISGVDSNTLSASLSTVIATPTSVQANGVDGSIITVTVLDVSGNPVEGASVEIFVSGSGNSITQPASVTNVSGIALGAFATTVAESKTITAKVNGSIFITDTAIVNANAGSPSNANSSVIASPISGVFANGSDSVIITVSVYDAFMNPVVGEGVYLNITGSNNTLSPPNGVTNASGIFTSSLTSTTAESKIISASLMDSIGVLSSTASVSFDPAPSGVPDDSSSTVIASGSGQLVTDGYDSRTVTVTVLDSNLNPVVGEPVDMIVNTFIDIITPSSGITDGSGQFVSTFKSISPGFGSTNVQAQLPNVPLILSDNATILKITPDLLMDSLIVSLSDPTPGATGVTYTLTFKTVYTPGIDWGLEIDFGSSPNSFPTGSSVGVWTTVDGTESTSIVGGVVTITRNSDGTVGPPNPVGNVSPDGPATHIVMITNVTNNTNVGLHSLSLRGRDSSGIFGSILNGLYTIGF